MKKATHYLALVVFFCLALASCNKTEDTTTSKIYAPNNTLVSESMVDLTNVIAEAVKVDAKDLSIESISYLDVKKGFAAEVEIYFTATDKHTKVLYVSPLLKDDIRYDSSIEVTEVAANITISEILNDPTLYFCSCGGINTMPNGCEVGTALNRDGTIFIDCFSFDCPAICRFFLVE